MHVQLMATVFVTLQFQRLNDTLLFAVLDHGKFFATFFGKSGILHFAGTSKVVHDVVESPIGGHRIHDNGSSNFFDFSCIKIGRQRWIQWQP